MPDVGSGPKVVAGQSELEAIYIASRKADLGAAQHERLKVLAQSVMAVLEKASVNGEVPVGSKKSDDAKSDGEPDARDDG